MLCAQIGKTVVDVDVTDDFIMLVMVEGVRMRISLAKNDLEGRSVEAALYFDVHGHVDGIWP